MVHVPPNCTECAPSARACATTQRQVNTRQSPSVQPPGFPAAPNRRTCKQTWTRYLGGICRRCVPRSAASTLDRSPRHVSRPDARPGPSDGQAFHLPPLTSGHISQHPCKRSTYITTRELGRREQPVRHRLPAHKVGRALEDPGTEVTAAYPHTARGGGINRSIRGIDISVNCLNAIASMEFSNLPRRHPTPKSSGWLAGSTRLREIWATQCAAPLWLLACQQGLGWQVSSEVRTPGRRSFSLKTLRLITCRLGSGSNAMTQHKPARSV